jgi:hypothetical protein
MTPEKRAELIQQYESGPKKLREALGRVPPDALDWKPSDDTWSAREVVCHCGDSEMNAATRIRYLLCERAPLIVGYDQDLWAQKLSYAEQPVEPALAAVEAARATTLPILRRLTDEQWAAQGEHTESGHYTADEWLGIYAEHLEVHSRQIDRLVAAFNKRQR